VPSAQHARNGSEHLSLPASSDATIPARTDGGDASIGPLCQDLRLDVHEPHRLRSPIRAAITSRSLSGTVPAAATSLQRRMMSRTAPANSRRPPALPCRRSGEPSQPHTLPVQRDDQHTCRVLTLALADEQGPVFAAPPQMVILGRLTGTGQDGAAIWLPSGKHPAGNRSRSACSTAPPTGSARTTASANRRANRSSLPALCTPPPSHTRPPSSDTPSALQSVDRAPHAHSGVGSWIGPPRMTSAKTRNDAGMTAGVCRDGDHCCPAAPQLVMACLDG
jgi:hypothetical protein